MNSPQEFAILLTLVKIMESAGTLKERYFVTVARVTLVLSVKKSSLAVKQIHVSEDIAWRAGMVTLFAGVPQVTLETDVRLMIPAYQVRVRTMPFVGPLAMDSHVNASQGILEFCAVMLE